MILNQLVGGLMNKILVALVLAVLMSENVFSQTPVGNSPTGAVGGALTILDEYSKAKVKNRKDLCIKVINEGELMSPAKVSITNVENSAEVKTHIYKNALNTFRLEIMKAKNIIFEDKWEIVVEASTKSCRIVYQGWVNNE